MYSFRFLGVRNLHLREQIDRHCLINDVMGYIETTYWKNLPQLWTKNLSSFLFLFLFKYSIQMWKRNRFISAVVKCADHLM